MAQCWQSQPIETQGTKHRKDGVACGRKGFSAKRLKALQVEGNQSLIITGSRGSGGECERLKASCKIEGEGMFDSKFLKLFSSGRVQWGGFVHGGGGGDVTDCAVGVNG